MRYDGETGFKDCTNTFGVALKVRVLRPQHSNERTICIIYLINMLSALFWRYKSWAGLGSRYILCRRPLFCILLRAIFMLKSRCCLVSHAPHARCRTHILVQLRTMLWRTEVFCNQCYYCQRRVLTILVNWWTFYRNLCQFIYLISVAIFTTTVRTLRIWGTSITFKMLKSHGQYAVTTSLRRPMAVNTE